jgi:ABC-type Fe3+ transport system permease subunit
MLSSQGESTFIPNLIFDLGINRTDSFVIEPALNDRFTAYGWTNSNFIEGAGRKILIWIALLIVYPFIYYMKKKYADKHKFCKLWEVLESRYRYNLLLRGVIMSFASMLLSAILNIWTMRFTSIYNMVSLFAAIAFAIMLIYLPV